MSCVVRWCGGGPWVAAILYHPLQHPEYHIETCRNGIVELNTFFLIVRRQVTRGSLLNRLCDVAYNLTLSIRFLWGGGCCKSELG